jgi:hypothetical protein
LSLLVRGRRICLVTLSLCVLCLMSQPMFLQAQLPESWLDRPLANWNAAGREVPRAPAAEEPIAEVVERCRLTRNPSTAGERAVEAAGWIPFWNFGQRLVREDVEIVGGMVGADGMCRPVAYNVFVFAGDRFAGTLSPAVMTSRLDGASGAVAFTSAGVTADFARYSPADPLCCPSSRVTGSYRIDRTAEGPLVVPVTIRPAP